MERGLWGWGEEVVEFVKFGVDSGGAVAAGEAESAEGPCGGGGGRRIEGIGVRVRIVVEEVGEVVADGIRVFACLEAADHFVHPVARMGSGGFGEPAEHAAELAGVGVLRVDGGHIAFDIGEGALHGGVGGVVRGIRFVCGAAAGRAGDGEGGGAAFERVGGILRAARDHLVHSRPAGEEPEQGVMPRAVVLEDRHRRRMAAMGGGHCTPARRAGFSG